MLRPFAAACAFAILCPHTASAQGRSLGVKGGVNLATQRNSGADDDPGLKSRVGLVGGVFVTLPLLGRLELQPEGLFTSKGTRVDLDGVKASLVADYAETPVLVRFSRRGTGTFNYYVAGGPAVAFLLRARSRTEFAGATEEIDITEQVNRVDFGVAMGGGVEVGSIVIDGRYTLGLQDIDKDKTDAIKTTNRAVSLTVGFKF
jgi:hypothetical protein